MKKSFTQFKVYWWVEADSPRLCRYSTRSSADIEDYFEDERFRIQAWPNSHLDDEEPIQMVILRRENSWFVRSPRFEVADEEYPINACESGNGRIWTDSQWNELMVIEAVSEPNQSK